MSCTPKKVRRNGGGCVCPGFSAHVENDECDRGTCRYGYCVVYRCRVCRGEVVSYGPVACRCDGAPRWIRHRGMMAPGYWDMEKEDVVYVHAAVKPSIAKRRGNA